MTASVLAYIPSPSQGVWHLGPVPLRAYALCIIVGIIAALIIGDRRWAERGGERGVIYDIALWAVPFGLIGGRLYHVMTDWRTYFGDDGAGFVAAFKIWDGGLGIWGAVALGGVGAWIGCRQRGIPLPAFGDAIAPGIVLAQAIGRLGNYFNQELYGRPTTLPWGLEIFERRNTAGALDSLNGVSTGQLVEVVHPTFLYELLWNVLVFAVLIWVDRRFKIGHGRLFALYVAAYCVGRFWVELMRSDMATHIAGIRVNTFTSTFVFIAAVVYIMVAPKGREDPATLRGNAVDDADSPVDELGEDLIAVAATSGVVAAAKVAGDEDKPATGRASGGQDAVKAEAAAPEVAEDAAAEAESEDAETAAEAVPEAEAEAEAEVEAKADPDVEREAEAEVEGEPESGSEAGPEDEAEVPAEAEAAVESETEAEAGVEPEADAEVEAKSAPEEGLGSVEGDELAEAQDDAPEVLATEVEGTAAAEALTAEVKDEAGVEPEPEADAESEAKSAPEPEAEVEPEEGLGSVEGDELAEAQDDAPEVLAAEVEGTAAAEALTAEPEVEAVGGEAVRSEAAAEAEDLTEQVATAPSEDIAEAEAFAAAGAAADAEQEAGLGPVEGDEAVEAETAAPEVHEAAVDAAEDAEALAEDVAAEAQRDAEPAPEAEDGSVAAGDAEEVAAEAASAEPDAEPEDGLGSVEGDEVAEAQEDAAEVHEAATEGVGEAEALAEDVAAEDVAAEAESADPEAEPEDGSVLAEGDGVAEAQEDAAEVQEPAAEDADEAEDVAAQPKSAEPRAPAAAPVATQREPEARRKRWWQRRG